MATPLFNFSGLASGLDTSSIVDTLIQLERAPINRLQVRKAEYNGKLDAWTAITSKSTAFRTAADTLNTTSDFDTFVGVTSSDEDTVKVELTGKPSPTSVSLTVVQLAATHQIATGTGFATNAALVGAGTFSITTSSATTNITTDSTTTLLTLAQKINSASTGVNATIIKVTDSDHRLLLTSDKSGASDTFTMSTALTGFASQDLISTGTDATARIGNPTTGLLITRPSNTFTNVIDGVTLDLVKTGTINVDVSRDTEKAAEAITSMIDAANALLTELENQTDFNAASNTSSPLTSDSTARNMILDLRTSLSSVVSGVGTYSHLGDLGIEFTRAGTYKVDATKLKGALDTDFDAVVSFFSRSGTTTDSRATYLGATGSTVSGTYPISVTAAPEVPTIVGSTYVSSSAFEDMNISFGTTNALIGIASNSDLASAISQINTGLAIFGIDEVLADESSGAIRLTMPGRYGTANVLTVTNDGAFGLNAVDAGVDVAGTINAQAAIGTGQTLLSTAGNSTGLSALISATPTEVGTGPLALGNITVLQGLGGGIDAWLDLVEGIDGRISRARGEWDGRIESIDDSIESFELRVAAREVSLRREFTAMETALAQLQNQSQFFSSLLPQANSR